MKRASKSSLTRQYIVTFGVLLLLANIVLGVLLLRQSSAMVQNLIRKSMVSISDTAADLVDGDVLGTLAAEDVGTPKYNEIYNALAAFQNNSDIEYIYAVRQLDAETFVFAVDPDPVDPGAFGEKIVHTEALVQAGRGIPSVDNSAAEDRWGRFFTSFSPVFDSRGNVAGVIGVDFNADWYNRQIWRNTGFIVLFSLLFTAVGAAAFLMINSRVKRRFRELNAELATLSNDVDSLTEELRSGASYAESGAQACAQEGAADGEDDELRALGRRIRAMHKEMERYLNYMHAQVYTDTLSRVGNTTAYLERQKELEASILDGSAAFSVVMFDINDLKHINDRYGHACGDKAIRAAAEVIAASFDTKNTYRIGGDEFIAVVEGASEQELTEKLSGTEEMIAAYNETDREHQAPLSVSMGHAGFIPGQDHSFRDVFVRADQKMYERKDSYHRRNRVTAREES